MITDAERTLASSWRTVADGHAAEAEVLGWLRTRLTQAAPQALLGS